MVSFFSVLERLEKWFYPDKDDDIDTRVLTRYLRLWGYLGLWPDNEGRGGRFRFYYPRCLLIVACYTLIVSIIKIYHGIRTLDPSSITEIVFIIFVSCKTLVKTSTYIYQPKEIKKLCVDLEELHDYQLRHGNQHVTRILRRAKLLSKFISTYVGINVSLTAFFSAILFYGILLYYRKTTLRGWYPCDISITPCTEIVITQEIFTFFTEMQILNFSDCFLYDILSQALAQFKIVNYNFQHIREYVVERLLQDESVNVGNTISEGHTIVQVLSQSMQELRAEAGRLTFRKPVEHESHEDRGWIARRGGLVVPHTDVRPSRLQVRRRIARQVGFVAPPARSLRRERNRQGDGLADWREKRTKERRETAMKLAIERGMKLRLAECIRHHQDIISFTSNIQSVYNVYFLYQILCNLLETATMVLYISVVNSIGLKEFSMLFLIAVVFSQLFIMCWFANEITQEALNVKESIFACDWLDTTQSFKRSMQIVISSANAPVVLQAWGLVPLSMTTFLDVTRASHSHYMTMRTAALET